MPQLPVRMRNSQAKNPDREKTAQRLLFELKDKLPSDMIISAGTSEPGMIGQVLEALEVLGFSRNEVFPILRELKETGQLSQRVEDNVKLVLKRNAEKTNR